MALAELIHHYRQHPSCVNLAGLLASRFFELPSHSFLAGTVDVVAQKIAAMNNAAAGLQLRG